MTISHIRRGSSCLILTIVKALIVCAIAMCGSLFIYVVFIKCWRFVGCWSSGIMTIVKAFILTFLLISCILISSRLFTLSTQLKQGASLSSKSSPNSSFSNSLITSKL